MSDTSKKIVPIVIEALTARGWTEPEATQMVDRLLVEGASASLDYCSVVIPFGKYKMQTLGQVASENIGYLHWLLGQDWLYETYSFLAAAIQNVVMGVECETPVG